MDALVSNFLPVRKKWARSAVGATPKKTTPFPSDVLKFFPSSSSLFIRVLHVDSSGEVEGSKLLSDGCWTSRCLSFWQLVVWRHDRDGASSQTWNLHIFSKFDMYPCFRIGINKAADQLFTFSAARCPGQTLTVWQSACFGICSGKCLIPVDTDALIWTVCYCHLVHSYR